MTFLLQLSEEYPYNNYQHNQNDSLTKRFHSSDKSKLQSVLEFRGKWIRILFSYFGHLWNTQSISIYEREKKWERTNIQYSDIYTEQVGKKTKHWINSTYFTRRRLHFLWIDFYVDYPRCSNHKWFFAIHCTMRKCEGANSTILACYPCKAMIVADTHSPNQCHCVKIIIVNKFSVSIDANSWKLFETQKLFRWI